ncbi:uncharacterized protein LOC121729454 [Aricia agestis]|uniref:uncharacterized protein LOC121729454 n=1 Tax=Aricia agestis TaxID=91739 RepID=UPI001C205ADF|nr:uncharacterized protein LOC121729454 [Aricia agestis]
MKFLLVLSLCALAAAAPQLDGQRVVVVDSVDSAPEVQLDASVSDVQGRNILINALVRQLIAYIRNIINNGSILFGIPPLDPLYLKEYHLQVPAGLINLDLQLKNIEMTGIGGFVVHTSTLNLRPQLTFELDISVPELHVSTEIYDLNGDLLTAIPIYGNGKARFEVKNFRFQAKLHLGQSEDGKSIIIDRIENAAFQLPHFKSEIEGAIGGGDIDAIVNAIVEEVLIGYINRFHGAVVQYASHAIVSFGNPILEQLDTWRFIAPLM